MSAAKNVVGAMLSIPDREVGWLIPAIVQGTLMKLRHGPPDVIYSSAPPWTGQLVAVALRQVLRCPWVADFRDPWARAPWRGDRYRFALGAASVLERLVITRADRIVFVADGNRSDFLAHYGQPFATKFDHVPNGCDPAEFEGLERPPRNGRIPHVMVHAGSLYAGRTPLPLLKALVRGVESGAIDRAGFRLKFIGANANADLPGTCRQLGVEDMVEFLPRVPRRDSLRTMVSASSLLLLQPGHTVSVPGKLYEYLAARRPILAVAEEGEVAEVVRRSGIGVSVTPDAELAILDGLLTVVRMSETETPGAALELYDGYAGAATIERLLRTEALRVKPSTTQGAR